MRCDRSEGTGEETGGEIWDPLDIAGSVSDEALMWFRASELKHGRVSMLATVGYLTGASGVTFPGDIANGVTFSSINADGATRPQPAHTRVVHRGGSWRGRGRW